MSKVLIVEDDRDLSSTLRDWLELENYIVETVANGKDALHLMIDFSYDLIILDVQLPDMTGLEICREYRLTGGTAHILMLTAKSRIDDRADGLDAGADDYLTKPFHMQELAARLRSLMRRPRNLKSQLLEYGNIAIDLITHKVTRGGEEIYLQKMEFALLHFFMRHPTQVFSVDTLLDRVWKSETERSDKTMRALVKRLRDKIDVEGQPSLIKNVHGVGYKLDTAD